jgi:hypothetical protein
MFNVLRETYKFPSINTNSKESEIKMWKSRQEIKDCYKNLFKQIDPTSSNPETFMSKILSRLWKDKKKVPKIQLAFAISVCVTILDPKSLDIQIKELAIKPKLEKYLVSNLYYITIIILYNI